VGNERPPIWHELAHICCVPVGRTLNVVVFNAAREPLGTVRRCIACGAILSILRHYPIRSPRLGGGDVVVVGPHQEAIITPRRRRPAATLDQLRDHYDQEFPPLTTLAFTLKVRRIWRRLTFRRVD
jgi:hypothetical protein